ncbi:MAG: hypothetical protein V5A14_02975, partial [Desulfohalobiaceae bacterium]
MLEIVSLFGLGLLVGFFLRRRTRVVAWSFRAADWAVCLMLLFLVLNLGARDKLMNNLANLGWMG